MYRHKRVMAHSHTNYSDLNYTLTAYCRKIIYLTVKGNAGRNKPWGITHPRTQ